MHGGNIIIDMNRIADGGAVTLLDFGLTGMGHAYRDVAKLERDLWLFVNDDVSPVGVEDRCREIAAELGKGGTHVGNDRIARAVRGIQTLREIAEQKIEAFSRQGEANHFEYTAALLVQFMFAACSSSQPIELRKAALERARCLRKELENLEPQLKPSEQEIDFRAREDRAWRFAYSFLHLVWSV